MTHDGLLLHHKKDETLTLSNKMHEPAITVLRETDQTEKDKPCFVYCVEINVEYKTCARPQHLCRHKHCFTESEHVHNVPSILRVLITATTLSLGQS